jgi:hypothetical protein
MTKTFRDKDKWKIRSLVNQRSKLFNYPASSEQVANIKRSKKFREIQSKIDVVSKKYAGGLKPYSGRIRNSRKANSAFKIIKRRTKKRGQRQSVLKELKNWDEQ